MKKSAKMCCAIAFLGAAVSAVSGITLIYTEQAKKADKEASVVYTDTQIISDEYTVSVAESDVAYEDTSETTMAPATGSIVAVEKTGNMNVNMLRVPKASSNEKNTLDSTTTEATTENISTEAEGSKTYPEFADKAVVVASGVINMRKDATIASDKVATLNQGAVLNILSRSFEWTKVSSGSCTGYVRNDLLAFDDEAGKFAVENPGIITYDSAVAVETPATEETTETPETQAPATEETTEAPVTETPVTETPADIITEPSEGFQPVVDYALQFVGNPYVYGGSSLTEGTDCSGFTMSVYAAFGYYLPHASYMQPDYGKEVALSAVAPGDLIFYTNGGTRIGHVALYIGNGQIVHASTPSTGIIISNMYYGIPCKAVRIVY